ncbi:MAG: YncE family protein [Acidobacteriota bacterium]
MKSAVFLLICGCTASASEVEPPQDQLFFPTGMGISPDDSVLFVANGNSELRYDSGSIAVIDLASVDQTIAAWTASQTAADGCTPATDHRETLVCDEAPYIVSGAGARIGNFASDIAIQTTNPGELRLIVPTRGDPSITWLDWDGTRLSCDAKGDSFPLCDDPHRLSYVGDLSSTTQSGCDPSQNPYCTTLIADEPFNAFADSTGQFAIVTHLTTGSVSLIDSPIGGDATISDVATGLFAPDPLTGLRGATGVAGRTPGSAGDIVYVGSRSENRVQQLTVGRPENGAAPYLIPGNFFFLDKVGNDAGGSTDTRGMAFSPSGDRLYLINRNPASLQIYDTSLGPTGFPQDLGVGGTSICRDASTLAVMDAGDGERVFVTCFDDGQVWVIDPRGLSSVEDIIDVGRGPYAIVASPTRKKVYVTNFLEDTVAVIDVAPTSPMRDRVVLRLGLPRAP